MSGGRHGWLASGWFLVACAGVVSLMAAGCSVETRYRILTIFFEGVPPPGSKPASAAAGPEAGGRLPDPVSFHAAFREGRCLECHARRGRRFLKTPTPDLCWACHERPPAEKPWRHAPARAGECLSCHVGHEAMTDALLAAVEPALCYRCHRDTHVQLLPAHQGMDLNTCRNCHPPHEGGTVGVPWVEEAEPEEFATTATAPVRAPSPEDLGTTAPGGVAPIFEK